MEMIPATAPCFLCPGSFLPVRNVISVLLKLPSESGTDVPALKRRLHRMECAESRAYAGQV